MTLKCIWCMPMMQIWRINMKVKTILHLKEPINWLLLEFSSKKIPLLKKMSLIPLFLKASTGHQTSSSHSNVLQIDFSIITKAPWQLHHAQKSLNGSFSETPFQFDQRTCKDSKGTLTMECQTTEKSRIWATEPFTSYLPQNATTWATIRTAEWLID